MWGVKMILRPQVCEGPCDINFIIRGCALRLCVDVCVPSVFCVYMCTTLQTMEYICACVKCILQVDSRNKQNCYAVVVSAAVHVRIHSGVCMPLVLFKPLTLPQIKWFLLSSGTTSIQVMKKDYHYWISIKTRIDHSWRNCSVTTGNMLLQQLWHLAATEEPEMEPPTLQLAD